MTIDITPPEEPPTRTSKSTEKERGFLYYVGFALSVALLLGVVFLGAVLIVVPKLAGATPLTVLTNSMAPGLPPGTLIMVRPVEMDDIEVGDIITYQIRSGEPDVITHRVIGIQPVATGEMRLIMQGDNNGAPDELPVRKEQVQGRFWYSVPYAGFVNAWVNGTNRPWILPVIAGLLLAYAAWMILSGIFGRKKKPTGRRVAGR